MTKRLVSATANRPGRNIFIHPSESPDSGATTMSILYRHLMSAQRGIHRFVTI